MVVPRTRFAPVKTCADLLMLRSDAYVLGSNFTIALNEACGGVPPTVKITDDYKFVDQLEAAIPNGNAFLRWRMDGDER